MKKLLFAAALLVLPAVAFASGVDVTWGDCVGGTTTQTTTLACTGTAIQTRNLFLCFKSPISIPNSIAYTAYLNFQAASSPAPLQPFWHYEPGGCQRLGGTSPNGVAVFDVVPASCTDIGFLDVSDGDGTGGLEALLAYGPDFPIPGRSVMITAISRGAPIPIVPDANYYMMHIAFNNRNRPGAGAACAGCGEQLALVWNTILIESSDGFPPYQLSNPDKGSNCGTFFNADPGLCDATPTRNTTWGQLKALYR
jgi:hypothetical protein